MNVKHYIIANQNGVNKGYIKSVSYARRTFTLTQNINEAKSYVSEDHIQGEIDKLAGMSYGYIFIYI